MPYEPHPVFKTPPDRTTVWRYMDFLKFADLLERRTLWFSRLDKLEDPREGRLTPRTKEYLRRRQEGDGETIIHGHEQLRSSQFVNCWHASKGQSAAMWRLYSPTGYAIAIGSSVGRLKKALAGTPDQVMIGRVTYVDSNRFSGREPRNLFDPSLIKDRSFSHEHEVRLLLWVLLRPGAANGDWNTLTSRLADLPPGMRVPVDISMLIKDVLVDPHAEAWVTELIAKLLERAGIRTAVRQSDLYRLPT
ncbi:MAG: DUF2971 domain-containing protein [Bryobacteraceae bacterium]|jgi:hypothetical protein